MHKLTNKIFLRCFLALGLVWLGLGALAQDIPAKPNPPRLVNDYAGILVQSEVNELERKLVAYDDSTSTQIAIVIIKTTGDYDIAEYSLKVLREWGIGGQKNNGVLILAAMDDRKIRIETGYGMEGSVPDAVAFGIINKVIKPAFREGHYYQGLDEAVDKIFAAAAGEYKGVPRSNREDGGGGGGIFGLIILLIILAIIFGSRGGGGGGGGRVISRRGDSVFGGILGGMIGSSLGGGSRGGGWGGGGGGFGGGGFGGFGGGSGGGGGASGSW